MQVVQVQVVVQLDDQRAAWWELNHPKAEHGGDHGNQHTGGKFPKEKLATPLPAGITQKMIDQLSSLRRIGHASADSNLWCRL